jgi:3-isopropylmalate dehydrogenase
MGIAPSGELGDHHGLFQGAHGSAPDIAGQNIASPLATVLSGSFMLRWLGDRHLDKNLTEAAGRIERAVELTLSQGKAIPRDLGGLASCTDVTQAICRNLQ